MTVFLRALYVYDEYGGIQVWLRSVKTLRHLISSTARPVASLISSKSMPSYGSGLPAILVVTSSWIRWSPLGPGGHLLLRSSPPHHLTGSTPGAGQIFCKAGGKLAKWEELWYNKTAVSQVRGHINWAPVFLLTNSLPRFPHVARSGTNLLVAAEHLC